MKRRALFTIFRVLILTGGLILLVIGVPDSQVSAAGVTITAQAQSAMAFPLLAPAQAPTSCIPLEFEEVVTGTITDTVSSIDYCFSAVAGQWVSVRAFPQSGTLDKLLQLYAPDGSLIVESNGTFFNSQLPQVGTYRLEVNPDEDSTGNFRLRLELGRKAAPADIDRDCDVDNTDNSILLSFFGTSGNPDSDLDLNGTVNIADLSMLLSTFGYACRDVQFSAATYSVGEALDSVAITVTLSAASGLTLTNDITLTVSYSTVNGTATAGNDYLATRGIITFAPGITNQIFLLPILDDTLDEANETVHLALNNSFATLGTSSHATLTIVDDDPPPTVFLTESNYSVDEDAGTATITTTLSPASERPVTVTYTTQDGTATAGNDYAANTGVLTFAPGTPSTLLTVPILDDTTDEHDEVLTLALLNPVNAELGTVSSAQLHIIDNDTEPTVQFSQASYSVNENTATLTIDVMLSAASAKQIMVMYATSNGSAVAGSDYTATSGTLTFAPGITSQQFTVTITNDTVDEANESIDLTLSSPINAILGTPSATITITDDDDAPTVQFSQSTYSISEDAGTATVNVVLSGSSAHQITVAYATSNGSATAGNDYTSASGILTFAPGTVNKTFIVPILSDALDELDENINIVLSGPTNATLGERTSATLTIVDEDGVPSVQFGKASYTVSEGTTTAAIDVKLSAASAKQVAVNYATNNGSAIAGNDYTVASGTLTFTPSTTLQTFTVPILNDTVDESDETVNLVMSTPTNAVLGNPATASLTIVDDDSPTGPLPAVLSVAPTRGFNNTNTYVEINGANFSAPIEAYLCLYETGICRDACTKLLDPSLVSPDTLFVIVQANIAPGEYCASVTNGGGRTGMLPDAFTVLSGPPELRKVLPTESYLVPADVHLYGFNFAPGINVTLNNIPLQNILVESRTHLRATIPEIVPPGTYSITASYDASTVSILPSAFTILGTQEDLFGQTHEIWVDPVAPHAGQAAKVGMVVHRQGGDESLSQVLVRFFINDQLIGDAATPLLSPSGSSSTERLDWIPSHPGEFVLKAVLDPHNQIQEVSESNNILTRTLTVLPPTADSLPPRVEVFTIDGGNDTVTETLVHLNVTAIDLPEIGAVGVSHVRYIEFEYSQAARLWIPVQDSEWLEYEQNHAAFSWLLTSIGGIHYIQAWAKDAEGNISPFPYQASVNYVPPVQSIGGNQTHLYRRNLAKGESMHVTLRPISGDADLYIWPPDWQSGPPPWVSNLSQSAEDAVSFVAPVEGTYQIEVYGYTDARYELIINNPILFARVVQPSVVDPMKPLPTAPVVHPNSVPPRNIAESNNPNRIIYLPTVGR